VPPETIHAWEIGSKNEFFEKRLQVNLDAFWYDYYGSERTEQTYPPPQLSFLPFGDVTSYSAGHSRFKGVNFTVNAAITTTDRASLSVQYIDARYVNFVVPAIYKNTTQVRPSVTILATPSVKYHPGLEPPPTSMIGHCSAELSPPGSTGSLPPDNP
jgi:iron complex outermembrane receptor protein